MSIGEDKIRFFLDALAGWDTIEAWLGDEMCGTEFGGNKISDFGTVWMIDTAVDRRHFMTNNFRWPRSWLPQIKRRYCIVIFLLLIILLGLIIWRYCVTPCVSGALDAAVQALSAGAAAAAAVIALGLADPPKREISIEQEGDAYLPKDERTNKIGHRAEYTKAKMPMDYPEGYPEKFHSCRVGFRLVNESGFVLKKPKVTVKVPDNRRHPIKKNENWYLTCNAWFGATLGSSEGILIEDRFIILANLWEDWGRGAKKDFWVRMVLDSLPEEPFAIEVSVSSGDAEGGICKVKVEPKVLLDQAT